MPEKLNDIIQSSFSIIIFLSIVGISTMSVLALNPRDSISESQRPGVVEGAKIEKASTKEIYINNLENTKEFNSNLTKKDDSYLYSVRFQMDGLKDSFQFVEVYNDTDIETYLEFESTLEGFVQDDLTIRVKDEITTYAIYDPTLKSNTFKIKLPANSYKKLEIEFELNQKVNFPLNVSFTLK